MRNGGAISRQITVLSSVPPRLSWNLRAIKYEYGKRPPRASLVSAGRFLWWWPPPVHHHSVWFCWARGRSWCNWALVNSVWSIRARQPSVGSSTTGSYFSRLARIWQVLVRYHFFLSKRRGHNFRIGQKWYWAENKTVSSSLSQHLSGHSRTSTTKFHETAEYRILRPSWSCHLA